MPRKYKINDHAFSTYTTDSAYWAGFIAADGCVYNKTLTFALKSTDIQAVEHLKSFLQAENPIYQHKTVHGDKTFYSAGMTVTSTQIVEDLLVNYDIHPHKSLTLKWAQQIPNFVRHAFVRGYFDGDGTIGRHGKNSSTFRVAFLGTMSFLQTLKSFLNPPRGTILLKEKGKKVYRLQYNGNKQVRMICEGLYQDSSVTTRLERKYQRYLELCGG